MHNYNLQNLEYIISQRRLLHADIAFTFHNFKFFAVQIKIILYTI